VRAKLALLMGGLILVAAETATCQDMSVNVPHKVVAGSAFSVQSSGSGKAVLYIVGPDQTLRHDVQLGQAVSFPAGSLYNAGHYIVILVGPTASDKSSLDVVPAVQPADLSFLARPSRLPVSLHNGISGTVYVFDSYQNLMISPQLVSFELSNPSSPTQERKVMTKDGAAMTQMDSTSKAGSDKFVAQADGASSTRVVQQVAGDPCGLKMAAKPSGQQIEVETDPVRDCSGNAVPDGTIVTFTESFKGTQSTVDVPLKRGIAQVDLPDHNGATISAASGVVLGNEIHLEK
jgi:hypothetical protein